MLGFLNIYKPANCTSHDVVAKLRKILNIKRIGHSGTLDPFATGVLVAGINEATRLFEYLHSDKIYLATIQFGLETNTNDITGDVLYKSDKIPQLPEVSDELNKYKGKIKQVPPIVSAINIKGERAYKLARENKINLSDLKEREVEIYSINIISYNRPRLVLKIHCSSGTYIRSIARDLGKTLNTYAIVSSLERTQIGIHFSSSQSINLESITSSNWEQHLIPPDKALDLPKLYINQDQIKDICFGKSITISNNESYKPEQPLLTLDNNNNLVAIGLLTKNDIIKPIKVFYNNAK